MPARNVGVLVAVFSLGAACNTWREATTPREMKAIAHREIHSAMHVMAAHVHNLDDALRDDALPADEKQRRVLGALDGIAAEARNLHPPGATVSHAMLHDKLPQFIRDIEGARAAAAAEVPQYFLAGSVSGACMACHRP